MAIITAWKTPVDVTVRELEKGIAEMLMPFGGMSAFVAQGDHVVLKPDLMITTISGSGMITSANLVEAVVRLVQNAGAATITIAEACENEKAFAVSGYEDVAKITGAKLVNLSSSAYVKRNASQYLFSEELSVYQTIVQADVVINLPTLQTLPRFLMRCSMMNLMGCIPDFERQRFLGESFDRALVDLYRLLQPNLTIVDAVIASELGKLVPMNMVLAGIDMIALDTVAAAAIGVDAGRLQYVVLGDQYGLGTMLPADIKIGGDDLRQMSKVLKQSRPESIN